MLLNSVLRVDSANAAKYGTGISVAYSVSWERFQTPTHGLRKRLISVLQLDFVLFY